MPDSPDPSNQKFTTAGGAAGGQVMNTAWEAAPALSGRALFDPVDFGRLGRRDVRGFQDPIPAVCYKGHKLRSPFPMGGLATGYLELRGNGHLGRCSIFNEFTPPRKVTGPLLELRPSLEHDEGRIPLDADHCDITVLTHFPVCNMRFAVKGGPVVWLQVFTPVIPGDAERSNTPGVVISVSVDDPGFDGFLCLNVQLGESPFPHHAYQTLAAEGLKGKRVVYNDGHQDRGDVVLAVIKTPEQAMAGARPDQIGLSATARVIPEQAYRFILSWHMPHFRDSSQELHQHRYASRFGSAIEVAASLNRNLRKDFSRVRHWQAAIYRSGQPDWLANALVQSMYTFTKNSLWLDRTREDDWYEPEGLFVTSESFRSCPVTEPMAVRSLGHLPVLLAYPELEKSTLAAFAHFQLRTGELPASFGTFTSLRDPRYHCQHPITASLFVLMVHRYWARSKDLPFIQRMWPQVQDAIKFARELDVDDDGLVNEHPHALPGEQAGSNHYYEIWPWQGSSPYTAGTWLAALRAAQAMGMALSDASGIDQYGRLLKRGLKAFHAKLWNGRYFRLYHDRAGGNDETCLSNQLIGQFAVRLAGLEPLFDRETCTSVYKSIERYNAQVTQFGIINGGNAPRDPSQEGTLSGEKQVSQRPNPAAMIFFGENMAAACTGMYEKSEHAELWARRLVHTVHEHQASPFDQPCVIRNRTGDAKWGTDYYANAVLWAAPLAREGLSIAEACAKGGWMHKILRAARGED